jgi:hypothetical protein
VFGNGADQEEEVEASLVTQSARFDTVAERLEALQNALRYCPIELNLVMAREQGLGPRDAHIVE